VPDGVDPVAGQVARRGRRDPELAIQLGINDDDEEGEQSDPESPILLFDGDVVGAKATIDVLIDGREHWFTYEARTRIQPGETEAEANWRIQVVANVRAVELADDMEERLAARSKEHLMTPIRPRQ
jgi:hypothetical protein